MRGGGCRRGSVQVRGRLTWPPGAGGLERMRPHEAPAPTQAGVVMGLCVVVGCWALEFVQWGLGGTPMQTPTAVTECRNAFAAQHAGQRAACRRPELQRAPQGLRAVSLQEFPCGGTGPREWFWALKGWFSRGRNKSGIPRALPEWPGAESPRTPGSPTGARHASPQPLARAEDWGCRHD